VGVPSIDRFTCAGTPAASIASGISAFDEVDVLERRYGLRFEPSYPGVTAGVEDAGGCLRLVLACIALGPEEKPLGVAFTALMRSWRPEDVERLGSLIARLNSTYRRDTW
jgi:hypothetical protein